MVLSTISQSFSLDAALYTYIDIFPMLYSLFKQKFYYHLVSYIQFAFGMEVVKPISAGKEFVFDHASYIYKTNLCI